MNIRKHWFVALGLAMLYASGFYLPLAGNYYVPAFGSQILYPSAIAVLVIFPLSAWFYSRYDQGNQSGLWSGIVIAMLCWIAVVSAFSAAGYSALNIALIVSGAQILGDATRWIRLALVIVGITTSIIAVHSMRRHWLAIFRLLSILGYAYALLAAIRIVQLPQLAFGFHDSGRPPAVAASKSNGEIARDSAANAPKSRQVVWIILDELDYNDTLGQSSEHRSPPMPNLEQLARVGVSASDAYAPAKDTVASLPMLLTGYPAVGQDVKDGALRLKTRSADVRIFQESDSIFGRLPDGPDSAAILGFYHPYCSLFPSVSTCVASPYINAGRWFDALTFFSQPAIETARFLPASGEFLPGVLFRWFEPMYRITEDTLREFPRFLSMQNKSLVFVHVNLPHLPGDYSQRWLHKNTVGDDSEVYRRNLQLTDQLVGEAMSTLQARSKQQDILLIVSADHWFRLESPLTAQRIPWIAWHVGDSDGIRLDARISTVHTADLVLSFLQGQIDTQGQIAAWWRDQPFFPTLMPHGFTY
jgi:Sulfatase